MGKTGYGGVISVYTRPKHPFILNRFKNIYFFTQSGPIFGGGVRFFLLPTVARGGNVGAKGAGENFLEVFRHETPRKCTISEHFHINMAIKIM